MDIALLLLVVALLGGVMFALVRRGPSRSLPTSDNFRSNTGFPGLDVALEDYYTDPSSINEAEIVFQTEYAEGAIDECCFPE